MIEDLKTVRDALNELIDWDHPTFDQKAKDSLATLDRIIAEATPSTDALKILRHVNNWSEIETAPKDGTEILLGRFEDGVIEDIIKDYWYEDRVMAAWAEYPAVFDNSPTHWARLPLLLGCSAPNAQPEKLDVEAITDIAWDVFFNSDKPAPYNQMKDVISHLASAGYFCAPLPRIDGLEEVIEWCQDSYSRGNRPNPFAKDLKILFKAARAYLKASGV